MATATTPERKWAREYETIYILRPTADEAAAQKIAERASDVIKRLEGQLTKLDNWGKRRLAYPIQKHARGQFVHLKYVGYSDLVAELERNLRLLDDVIRFQTILLEEQVDPNAVVVDPEEVKYLHIEDDTEEESPEEARARSLGMAPAAPKPSEEPKAEEPAAEQGDEAAPAEATPAETAEATPAETAEATPAETAEAAPAETAEAAPAETAEAQTAPAEEGPSSPAESSETADEPAEEK